MNEAWRGSYSLHLERFHYGGDRQGFMLAEDTYAHWVLLSVERGAFDFALGDLSGRAEFGDLVFCPPGGTLWRRSVGERLSFFFAEFRLDGEKDGQGVPSPAAGKISVRDVSRLSSTYDYLRGLHAMADPADAALARHLLADLLHLCRLEQRTAASARKRSDDPLMQRVAAWMREEAHTGVTMGDLAARAGISQSQLTRRFRAAFGLSPVEFLTRVRLKRACELLVSTDDTIDAIAEQCGYETGFYLSRVFTRHLRMAPSVYRRTHRV